MARFMQLLKRPLFAGGVGFVAGSGSEKVQNIYGDTQDYTKLILFGLGAMVLIKLLD